MKTSSLASYFKGKPHPIVEVFQKYIEIRSINEQDEFFQTINFNIIESQISKLEQEFKKLNPAVYLAHR